MARPPSLPEVTKRDLAMRKVRAVPADECEADGRYVWDNAPALAWGGEPINRSDGAMLHDGPNGEKMGWASMETRMCILRLPRVGDRIQSFGATVDIRDKTTHYMLWAYDVDRGDLLTVFEVVSLAFDTVGRRAMSIPASIMVMAINILTSFALSGGTVLPKDINRAVVSSLVAPSSYNVFSWTAYSSTISNSLPSRMIS